jgi:two-component system sensor histidine kinase/response regulator
VILLTSSSEAAVHESNVGIDYVLIKPVRQSRLLDAIRFVMADHLGRRTERELDGHERSAERPRRKVLVAEDQPVNWMLVERLLANRGHSVRNAINGQQALEMLEDECYDLVLMDCQMPVLDGFAATRELRLREATTHAGHTPVIAMTANAMEGDRERCLAAGMDDYLAKPITSRAIDEVLARWLPEVSAPEAAVLDPQRISELRSLFPGEDTVEMFAQLRREGDIQLHRIDAALEHGDNSEVTEGAHRLLSSARMIGAAELIEAATELQAAARDDLTRAAPLAQRVRELWDEVSRALEAELRSHVR